MVVVSKVGGGGGGGKKGVIGFCDNVVARDGMRRVDDDNCPNFG